MEPDLYTYLDFRKYLRDWYAWKKQVTPSFSYRAFARRVGLKTPSLLHHVMKGKRNLTPQVQQGVCKALKLKAAERAFFGQLVALDQASTSEERNRIWSEISASRHFQAARHVEGAGFEYLSHWYYPAIRELAHCPDFRADPKWIAAHLRPNITVAKAKRALQTLFDMELLVENKDGSTSIAEASVVTPHEVAGLAVHNYHYGMADRAKEAIDGFDPEVRHFGALTVAVPQSLVGRLKDEVAAFQERILELCDNAGVEPDAVYQLNLQLFPLSKVEEPGSPE